LLTKTQPKATKNHLGITRLVSEAFAGSPGGGYLRGMKSIRVNLVLAAVAALFLTAACSVAPDAKEDPNADAAYKREHRSDGYREAQSSQPRKD